MFLKVSVVFLTHGHSSTTSTSQLSIAESSAHTFTRLDGANPAVPGAGERDAAVKDGEVDENRSKWGVLVGF